MIVRVAMRRRAQLVRSLRASKPTGTVGRSAAGGMKGTSSRGGGPPSWPTSGDEQLAASSAIEIILSTGLKPIPSEHVDATGRAAEHEGDDLAPACGALADPARMQQLQRPI